MLLYNGLHIALYHGLPMHRGHTKDLFMPGFTCVSLIRGPVLKLRMIHCSTGKVSGLSEIPDP